MQNKTKVILSATPKQCVFVMGDKGYIDGYIQGGDGIPYAVVICDKYADFVPLQLLTIITENEVKL